MICPKDFSFLFFFLLFVNHIINDIRIAFGTHIYFILFIISYFQIKLHKINYTEEILVCAKYLTRTLIRSKAVINLCRNLDSLIWVFIVKIIYWEGISKKLKKCNSSKILWKSKKSFRGAFETVWAYLEILETKWSRNFYGGVHKKQQTFVSK